MKKIIVIEGTDCSGKETQTKLLIEKLKNGGIKCVYFSFPNYNSPTGKIIGGSYLGKKHIGECLFPEGAVNVDPKVASLYYAADRLYNMNEINSLLEENEIVFLDRYVFSNMAHQGGKLENKKERLEMFKWLEELEFNLLKLPKPEIKIFLHMPFECSNKLKENRIEEADEHEKNQHHLINAEKTYLEIAELYNFDIIECSKNGNIKTIDEINEELMLTIKKYIK